MEIIGLSGYAGSGKDEAAKALASEGYTRVAFADVLRDIAVAIDPYVLEQTDDDGDVFIFRRLSDVIENYGWDFSKNYFADVRRLLQRLGTEAGRNILGENIWVDTAFSRVDSDKVVVTDVRFPNEAQAVRQRGGVLVRIHRPGIGPKNTHPSETSLEDYAFDYHIDNDGTIEEFHQTIKDTLL